MSHTARWVALASACLLGIDAAGADERVQLTATDGVQLVGHLEGSSGPGIVFAHGYRYDRRSWTSLASRLAATGFRTLTFDCRGYGESGGERNVALVDRDLEGAYRYLVGRKIRPVYLIGASMGGTAALVVAARVPVAGVAALSAPISFQGVDAAPILGALRVPTLLIAARGDGPAAAALTQMATAVPGPVRTTLVDGDAHGTDLLSAPSAEEVIGALRAFLRPAVSE